MEGQDQAATVSLTLKTGSSLFLSGMFAGFKQGYQEAAGYIFMSHTDSGTMDAQNDSA